MAVTVTWFSRGGVVLLNGSTTAPTATQASQLQKQSVIAQFGADTDVQALITHNWGLDASAPTYLEPEIFVVAQTTVANNTVLPNFTFDLSNTNVVKMNKLSSGGTAGNYIVTLRRPQSLGQ